MTEKDALWRVVVGASAILNFVLLWRRAVGKAESRDVSGGEGKPLSVRAADEFAPLIHAHPELDVRYAPLTHEHKCGINGQRIATLEQQSSAELAELRRVETKLDQGITRIEAAIVASYKELDDAAEERARKAHGRMNPISEAVIATDRRLTDHLENHRAGRV